MPQLHIPAKIRKNPELIEKLYGKRWRKPKILADVGCIEAIYGPPPVIRGWQDLRGYQHWMHQAIMQYEAVFLGAEMGLGKTAASLAAAVELLDAGIVKKVLIVAPLRVAENTWPEEIAAWAFARHLDYSVISGDLDERIAGVQADADVYIINRENLPWLHKFCPGRQWVWDMLIYDEASRLKGASKRTESDLISEFGVLSRMRFKFKKVVLLSGTPAPNGLIDLWGPIYICDRGQRLGKNITAYRDRWFINDTLKHRYEPRINADTEIMGRIEDIFFSLKAEDYLKLPPMIERDHVCELPPKAMALYKRLERTMALEEFNLEAVNNGVLTNKLLQLANGSLYLEDGSAEHIHDAKLDVLDSIMVEAFGRPVLLAYSYKFDMDRIKKRFPYARIYGEGKNDNRDWNAGRIKLMVTHPASAGHGLNFQHGGNIAVWYGLTWSLELYQQFIKRLHRSGQMGEHVFLHRILAKNTVDFDVLKTIRRKGATQDDITDAVRIRLERMQEAENAWKMAA